MGWGDDDKDGMMGCGEVVDGKGRQTYRMGYELHLDLLFVLDRGPVMDDVNISPTTMMGRRLTHHIEGHTKTRRTHLGTRERNRVRKRRNLAA